MNPTRYIPLILALCAIVFWYACYVCLMSSCGLSNVFIMTNMSLLVSLALYAACSLLPVLLILFSPQKVFVIWVWFALAWTAISAIIVVLVPAQQHTFFSTLPLTRDVAALCTGLSFAFISTVLILVMSDRKP